MSLFYKLNSNVVFDMSNFAIASGISCAIIGLQLNDLYCIHILNETQYKPNNLYSRYYKAKYTNLFIKSIFVFGLLCGGLYGYKKKPLLLNE